MVSPAAEAFAESLSTLKFAQRAKGVVTTPQVNEDLDPRMMANRYEAEIRRLRTELAERDSRTTIDLEGFESWMVCGWMLWIASTVARYIAPATPVS
eukprot:g25881.t1